MLVKCLTMHMDINNLPSESGRIFEQNSIYFIKDYNGLDYQINILNKVVERDFSRLLKCTENNKSYIQDLEKKLETIDNNNIKNTKSLRKKEVCNINFFN